MKLKGDGMELLYRLYWPVKLSSRIGRKGCTFLDVESLGVRGRVPCLVGTLHIVAVMPSDPAVAVQCGWMCRAWIEIT